MYGNDSNRPKLPRGALKVEACRALRLLGFALGRFAILGQIGLQAPQRSMAAKAFEIDIRVRIGRLDTDGRMTQMMECPSWRVQLPDRVRMAIGKPHIAIREADCCSKC